MSVYCHYQAWPATGGLLPRLRTEPRLYALYAGLLHHPRGPFDADRLDPAGVDDLLNELATREPFGSRTEVDGALAALRSERAAACAASPGLPGRAAYMQIHDEFEDRLATGLGGVGRADPAGDAARLMFGWGPLGPDLFPGRTSELQLVPHPGVAEAVGWLRHISPERFGWLRDLYAAWRQVYLDAAPRGEAIVIG